VLPITSRDVAFGERIDLARGCRRSNLTYVGNTRDRIRLKDRRERDLYALRCGAQLGTQKLAVADADGPGLLRNRVNGCRGVSVRYRAIRGGGDALFAAAMRRDDCGRYGHLQNGAGGKANL
jgi:hypothetical protein